MSTVSANQFIVLYTWFPLAILLFFWLLIGRFYQRFSQKRTYFRFFALPIILFGVSAVRYASIEQVSGDWLGDVSSALAGAILLVLCVLLFVTMLKSRLQ